MKSNRVVIPLFCIALGYVSGRHFPSPQPAPVAAPTATDPAGSSKSRTRDSFGASVADRRQPKTKASERTTSAKSAEPRVSIPISSVVGILSGKPAGLNGFENYEQSMGEALTLLGATDEERSQVTELMEQTKTDLFQTERQLLKPKLINDSEATLDLREMDQASAAIIERTQIGLKSILPRDLGEALVNSMNWNHFYRSDQAADSGGVRFKILRDASGKLSYEIKFSNGSSMQGSRIELTDEGRPLRADEVFPERWGKLLVDLELLPEHKP